jgi:L-lactate dehydrogenase
MRGHFEHREAENEIAENVKNSAYDIIQRKRATYFGVAMAVKRICEVIVRNEKAILPISTAMHGEHGIEDIVLSMPCVVGSSGIENQIPIVMSDEEIARLQESAKILKEILASLELN